MFLVLSAACATTRAEKLSVEEAFEGIRTTPEDPPQAAPKKRAGAKATPREARMSVELQATLVSFSTRARQYRQTYRRANGMPMEEAKNWYRLLDGLDDFLAKAPEETSSFDVIRARIAAEAELEQDARTYTEFPPDLTEAVNTRITRLAVRMAEVRRLGVKTKREVVAFEWPIEPVTVTSLFGRRLHPISHAYRQHFGLDLAAYPGQVVFAAARGTVVRAGWNGAHGIQVELQHGNGFVTRYSHLTQVMVEPGATVDKGDAVGLAGTTGSTTGPHLHFEIWKNGAACDPLEEMNSPPPVAPMPYAAL